MIKSKHPFHPRREALADSIQGFALRAVFGKTDKVRPVLSAPSKDERISKMKLHIKIKPNARVEKIEDLGDGNLCVWVRAAAREGRANEALIEILSDYLDVPKSLIRITAGHSSRLKTVSVDG